MQDFFQRHPALQPFMAAQLRAAATAAEADDAPVPTLLPILTLLSRLRCATVSSAPAVCPALPAPCQLPVSSLPCALDPADYGRLSGTCVADGDAAIRDNTGHVLQPQ